MINGYDVHFDDGSGVLLTLPITPSEITIKVGSNNKTITLINEGEINILKSPSLTEISFDARFPMRKYPYSRSTGTFESWWEKIKNLKENRKSFRFIVARRTPSGSRTWDTNFLVALEDFEIKESADEGDDVIISFNLKQYKQYSTKTVKLPTSKPNTTSTSTETRDTNNKTSTSKTYTVVSGDCLWNIAKKFYGSGSKYTIIYNANKEAIEADAKKHGKKSSSNGHWIWPGLKLTIPSE